MTALGAALARAERDQSAAVAAIRVAALTGLRIGEVLAMRWEHVKVADNTVVLPRTKTGRRVHGLPLAALELLGRLPRMNDYVFTTGRDAALSYPTVRKAFAAMAHAAGLSDVRLHDLRRTVMTSAARAGLGTHVLRDLLGHKTTAMADRYIRHAGAAVHEAQEHIGATIDAQLRGARVPTRLLVPARLRPTRRKRPDPRGSIDAVGTAGRAASRRSRSAFQARIEMSESLPCPNPDCEGVFTISDAPDGCSGCGLTWDEAANAGDSAHDEAPGSHGPN